MNRTFLDLARPKGRVYHVGAIPDKNWRAPMAAWRSCQAQPPSANKYAGTGSSVFKINCSPTSRSPCGTNVAVREQSAMEMPRGKRAYYPLSKKSLLGIPRPNYVIARIAFPSTSRFSITCISPTRPIFLFFFPSSISPPYPILDCRNLTIIIIIII